MRFAFAALLAVASLSALSGCDSASPPRSIAPAASSDEVGVSRLPMVGTTCTSVADCGPHEVCSSTVCACADGFYDNNGAGCAACDSSCATCSGPTADDCTSCGTAAVLAFDVGDACATNTDCATLNVAHTTGGVCTGGHCAIGGCDPGYFIDGGVCSACAAIANCASSSTCTTATDQTCGSCNAGFLGPACQYTDATTCNGHGTAQNDGSCVCTGGFTGAACNQCPANYFNYPTCDVLCDATTTCNGNGTCDTAGACACGAAFTGTACDNCATGYFNYPTCAAWTTCVAGQYVAVAGTANADQACASCAIDTFSTTSNASSCTPAQVCGFGQYISASGSATSDRTCSACPAGSYSNVINVGACTSYTTCVAGQYIATAGTSTADQTCAACGTGTYSSGNNAPSCTSYTTCATGQHVSTAGTATADRTCADTICSANEHVASHACAACAAGSTRTAGDDAAGGDTSCTTTTCAANQYVSSHTCVACAAGNSRSAGDPATGSDTACTPISCAANEYVSGHACVTCAAGSTRPAGDPASGSDTACNTTSCATNEHVASHACVTCAAGSTRAAGDPTTGSDTACATTSCAANEYVSGHACVTCAAGSTRAAGDPATGSDTACATTSCAANEHVASHACVTCATGSTRAAGDPATGSDTACATTSCAANEHVASHACVTCATGSTRAAGDPASGSDTACATTSCATNEHVASHACTTCAAGSTRAAGDPATGSDTACITTSCSANEHVSSHACVTCAAGSTRAAGDLATGSDTACATTSCATNEHVASHACVTCAAGSTRAAGDPATGSDTACITTSCATNEHVASHACTACAAGSTRVAGDPATGSDTACATTSCAANEYVSSHACVTCAAGSTRAAGDLATGSDTACATTSCATNEHVASHACVTCAAGSTRAAGDPATGSDTACITTSCATNEHVASHACTACAAGSTRVAGDLATGSDTACITTSCATNEHVASHACVTCAAGSTRAAGDLATGSDTACATTSCAANEYVSSHACVTCAAGSTRAAGDPATGSDTACITTSCAANEHVASHACTACAAGSTRAAGDPATGSDTACITTSCAANEHVASHACTACAAGSTRAAGDPATGSDTACAITSCAANEHVASHVCTTCPAGSTRAAGDPATGSDTTCTTTSCAANEHVASHACTACPAGSTRAAGDLATGSDTVCSGTSCGTNEHVVSHVCTACAAGSTRAAGDLATDSDTTCTGISCAANEHVASHVCTACAAGSTRTAGDLATSGDTTCSGTACAANEHVASHICTPCAAGSTRAAGDLATSGDTACAATSCATNEHVASHACVACAAGATHAAGDLATGGDTACGSTACAADQHVVTHACVTCATGTTRSAGDLATGIDTSCTAMVAATAGAAQSTTVATAFATHLEATVTDGNGNPVAGVTVSFGTPGSGATATLSAATAVTDSQGVASVTATAGSLTGSYVVTASVTGVTTTGTFPLTNTAGAPSTLVASGGTPQAIVVGAPFATDLSATVTDNFGNPVAGATVSFAPPTTGARATLSAVTALTNGSGVASVAATAGTIAGSYDVSAAVVGVATVVTFRLTNSAAAAGAIVANVGTPQADTVGTPFGNPLVVTVTDSHGNPVAGAAVMFSAPPSGATATLSANLAITNGSGVAQIVATAGTTAGSYVVSASVAGVATLATFALTNVAGPAAAIAANGGTPQTAAVASAFAFPLAALVTDSRGNPVSGALVAFTAPATGARATLGAATATTDTNGVATVSASAGTVAGGYTVTATSAGASSPASFALTNTTGPAANLVTESGNAQTVRVGNAFVAPLVARLTDAQGNGIVGVIVTFTAPATGASATLAAPSAVTGADGRVSVTATANAVTGSYSVQAAASGHQVTFALTNTPNGASAMTVASGDGQSATVGTPFVAALAARVVDDHGNPVPDVVVTFAVPATGASAVLGIASPTDASGYSRVTASANGVAGSYLVTATTAGVSVPLRFALTNVEGPGAAIEVVAGGGQSATVGAPFPTALTIDVKDASGNPVRNTTVTFQSPPAGARAVLSASTAVTDGSGRAHVDAVAGTIAGSYTVTASVTGVASPASLILSNTVGAAAAISAASFAQGQSAPLGQAFASPLIVTVTDRYGNPIAGTAVAFTAPATGASAVLGAATATTGVDGSAEVIATAGNVIGSYVVLAQVTGLGSQASFPLANLVGAPATVQAVSGGLASAVVATPFAAPLVVIVRDAAGNPVPNALVHFAAPPGDPTATLSGSDVLTDGTGQASTQARAANKVGGYQVTAKVDGAATVASFPLVNTAGPAAKLVATSTSSNQTAQVRTAFVNPLEASVLDAFDNPVAGVSVSFTAPASGATALLDAPSAVSDSGGHASVHATAGDLAGAFMVTASASGIVSPAGFSLQALPGAPAILSIVSGSAQSVVVGQTFAAPLVVSIVDAYGNPVPNADVTFTAPTSGATARLVNQVVKTNAAGRAETTPTAGMVAGAYVVNASALGVATSGVFTLTNVAGPASVVTADASSTPQSALVGTTFMASLRVQVTDSFGNPVAGAAVAFTTPASEPTAVLSATSAVTGLDGRVDVRATASTGSGTYDVTATFPGASAGQAATFHLTNEPAGASVLTVVSGGGQDARAGAAFAAPVVLLVRDRLGNPVSNAIVEATALSTGPGATITGVASDVNGLARLSLVANREPGVFTVTAIIAGATAPVSFSMTITAIPTTTTLTITPDSATANASTEMSVTVTAPSGIPAGQVRFMSDAHVLGTATLGPNGTVTMTVPLPPPGTYAVIAIFDQQGAFGASTSAPHMLTVLEDTGKLAGGGTAACSFGPHGGAGSGGMLLLVLGFVIAALSRRSRRRHAPATPTRRSIGTATLILLLVGASSTARAQSVGGVALGRWNPAPADSDWLVLDSVSIHGDKTTAVRVMVDSARDPFVVSNADGSNRTLVVSNQLLVRLGGALTLRDRYRLAIDLPVSPYQAGSDGRYNGYAISAPGPGIGTLTVAGDARIVGDSCGQGRIAVGAAIGLPTGQQAQLLGDGKLTLEPRIAIAAEDGVLAFAARGSILLRPTAEFAGTKFGHELRGSVGFGVRLLVPRLLIGPELITAYDLIGRRPAGTEWQLGIHHAVTKAWTVAAGWGRGLSSALGTPSSRLLVTLAWIPPVSAPDSVGTRSP